MHKIGKQEGLIRFDSQNGVEQGRKTIFTTRVYAYIGILAVLLSIVTSLLLTRSEVETIVLRMPGKLFERVEGDIENIYNFTLINKTDEAKSLNFELLDQNGAIETTGGSIIALSPEEIKHGALIIRIPEQALSAEKTELKIGVYNSSNEVVEVVKTNFLGPRKRKKR